VANTKMLGLGVALAVLMDAMVVRSLLVPAVMRLTGTATWWAPGPLRRFHDRFGLSEAETPEPAPAADPVADVVSKAGPVPDAVPEESAESAESGRDRAEARG
jgi:RND superfamily putative drug exporter